MFSHVYEENRNDQTEFLEYLKLLKERMPEYKPEGVTLVLDGGSNTKANLNLLDMHYICSFSLNCCKGLYQVNLSEYQELKLGERKRSGSTVPQEKYGGKERECILTYSPELLEGQLSELEGTIKKSIAGLCELNEKVRNPKLRIPKDLENLSERAGKLLKKYMREIIYRYLGKKLLITDRKDWETTKIIRSYYEQDNIEKLFLDTQKIHPTLP